MTPYFEASDGQNEFPVVKVDNELVQMAKLLYKDFFVRECTRNVKGPFFKINFDVEKSEAIFWAVKHMPTINPMNTQTFACLSRSEIQLSLVLGDLIVSMRNFQFCLEIQCIAGKKCKDWIFFIFFLKMLDFFLFPLPPPPFNYLILYSETKTRER